MPERSAYNDALQLLSRRELSIAECRARLLDRGHSADDADAAVGRLLEEHSLDDARVARAYARTAVTVKHRGRLRVARELHAKGIAREIVAEALGEVFGDHDERTLVARAVDKRLRGRGRLATPADRARLYQYLMRQGFTPAVVLEELRKRGVPRDIE